MNNKQNLRVLIKNPRRVIEFLKIELKSHPYFFDKLYAKKNEYILNIKNKQIIYSTKDKYSKHWFYPRYDNNKLHEAVVINMLINSLEDSAIFVDVGAYLGYFTCVAGKMCPKGKVYSFEINKHAFELLKKNVKLNKLDKVYLYNCAVSDKEGYIKIPKNNTASSTFSILGDKNKKNYSLIKSTRLDNFFGNKKKPDVLKIDVEGAEMQVLKGMQKIIEERKPTLFLELHGDILNNFNTNTKQIISFLIKRGYKIYEIENHRSQNKNEKPKLKEITEDSNIDYNTMLYVKPIS